MHDIDARHTRPRRCIRIPFAENHAILSTVLYQVSHNNTQNLQRSHTLSRSKDRDRGTNKIPTKYTHDEQCGTLHSACTWRTSLASSAHCGSLLGHFMTKSAAPSASNLRQNVACSCFRQSDVRWYDQFDFLAPFLPCDGCTALPS